MKVLFTIILFNTLFVFSQCKDDDKLDFGGSYLSRTKNYIPFDLDISDTIKYCCDIKKIKYYSDIVFKHSENYIIERGGEEFYSKLKIHQLEVNYNDSVKIVYENQNLYDISKYDVTYWILYTYINKNIKYGFGLEFDKSGKMISENKFPKYSKNLDFEKLTDFCNALELVKSDIRFKNKEVDYVELSYLDDINSFCWLVEEKTEPNSKIDIWEDRITNRFYVNANTNKLELVKENKHIMISCGYEIKVKSKRELRRERKKKKI